ncbi:class I SAM-dependent methyltransferase [Calditrichota bacterium GD2]
MIHLEDAVNNLLCYLKRQRKIRVNQEVVKVNLGSGLNVLPDWINIDSSLKTIVAGKPRPIIKMAYILFQQKKWFSEEQYCDTLKNFTFIHHNLEYGLPFENESVHFIYASHLIEHIFKEDVLNLFKEAHRVLRKDGVIRLSTPDLDLAIKLFNQGQTEEALYLFFKNSKRDYQYFTIHKYLYNFKLLEKYLREAGFTKVYRCSFKKGRVPDIDRLDNRPEQSLFVEAVK